MALQSLTITLDHAPYGRTSSEYGLDVILAGSACVQDLRVIFLADGVYHLVGEHDPQAIGKNPYTKAFGSLSFYEIDTVYLHEPSLTARNLTPADLTLDVTLIDDDTLHRLYETTDACLRF